MAKYKGPTARPKVSADVLAGIEMAVNVALPLVKSGQAGLSAHDTHLVHLAYQWVNDTKVYREWRMANPTLMPNVKGGTPHVHSDRKGHA